MNAEVQKLLLVLAQAMANALAVPTIAHQHLSLCFARVCKWAKLTTPPTAQTPLASPQIVLGRLALALADVQEHSRTPDKVYRVLGDLTETVMDKIHDGAPYKQHEAGRLRWHVATYAPEAAETVKPPTATKAAATEPPAEVEVAPGSFTEANARISEREMWLRCESILQGCEYAEWAIDSLMLLLWNLANQASKLASVDLAARLIDKLYTSTPECQDRCLVYLGTLLDKDYRGDPTPVTFEEATETAEELRGRPLWALEQRLASTLLASIAHPGSTAKDRAAYLDLAKRLGVTPGQESAGGSL